MKTYDIYTEKPKGVLCFSTQDDKNLAVIYGNLCKKAARSEVFESLHGTLEIQRTARERLVKAVTHFMNEHADLVPVYHLNEISGALEHFKKLEEPKACLK